VTSDPVPIIHGCRVLPSHGAAQAGKPSTRAALVDSACLFARGGLECGAVSTFYHAAQLLGARIQDACTLTGGLTGRVWCGLGRVALTGAAPVTKHTGAIGKHAGRDGGPARRRSAGTIATPVACTRIAWRSQVGGGTNSREAPVRPTRRELPIVHTCSCLCPVPLCRPFSSPDLMS
jgi:hypothetical protein